jgi:hypothetical protein
MRTKALFVIGVLGAVVLAGCGSSNGASFGAASNGGSSGASGSANGGGSNGGTSSSGGGSSVGGAAANGGGSATGGAENGGTTGGGGTSASGGTPSGGASGSGGSSSGGSQSDGGGTGGTNDTDAGAPLVDGGALGPTVTILHPGAGVDRKVNVSIYFHGSATDPTDGTLTGSALTWIDSLEGEFGKGDPVNWAPTKTGSHTVTLRSVDSLGYGASDSITFNITP